MFGLVLLFSPSSPPFFRTRKDADGNPIEKPEEEVEELPGCHPKEANFVRKLTGLDEKRRSWKDIETVGYLNLGSDAIHNLIDGLTLGVAWTDSVDLGVATLIAVICCELPQELGDFGVLVSAGFTKWQAILWNLCSACFAILGCIIGLAIGTNADTATPWLLALAAGNFLYISLVNMMPQVMKNIKDVRSGVFAVFLVSVGIALLFVIAIFEDDISDCGSAH